MIPSQHVAGTLTEAAQNGLRCALIYAAQFGEGGDDEGRRRADELLRIRDTYGLRLSGPNCMGVLSLRERLLLYPAARVRAFPAGSVGIVFQSGGTFQYWLQQAAVRGLGFSYAISSGNELDLGMADYLEFLVDDDSTRVIACLAEGIRNPRAFMAAAAKALEAGKPIVILKAGRSARGKEAALSHTGALAGDDAVFDAMCDAYGITRCDTLDDMIEVCLAFQAGRLPARPETAIITYSGSSKGLMLDYAEDSAITLAELSPRTCEAIGPLLDPGMEADNPLDIGATVAPQPKRFADICKIIAQDEGVGQLVVQGTLPVTQYDNRDPATFADLAQSTDKPILAWSRTAHNVSDEARAFQGAAGMPFLQGMPQAIRAARALVRYAEAARRGPKHLPPDVSQPDVRSPMEIDHLLTARGVQLPRSALVKDADSAAAEAGRLGFPVAVKLVSPDASHKTEVGGVSLGLRSADEVRGACADMAARLRAAAPQSRLDGFLVQEMVSGLELILGARVDPLYGPIVMIGMGGVTAEVIKDTALSLLPIDETQARAMLDRLRGKALLGPFRGRPARDVDAVVKALVGLSEVFLAQGGAVSDIEINPLIVLAEGDGARAVDLRVIARTS